ncbi:MAG: hypothetical protein ANABAC_1720 [Anaerolineae bacterium]|jgi:predicted nucleotidyltransferase|nr:MAG: hypothetical protein ANABAC_1720 [Anaerolineae bacterium]
MQPLQQLQKICEQFSIDVLYVFGSRSQEAAHFLLEGQPMPERASDLDVGILPGRPLSAREKVELMIALEDLFDVNRVDLVSLPDADPFLAANIVRGERLFARDSYQADQYELYIYRRAGDLIPLERERLALIEKRLKR